MKSKQSPAKKVTKTRAKKAVTKSKSAQDKQQKDLDQAAKFIKEKIDAAGSNLIEIGQYLFATFYENREEDFSDKSPTKHISLRKLAARDDVEMSHSHLRNAVLLAIQEKILTVKSFQQLRPSHKLLLVKVKNKKEKRKFATLAIDRKLSVKQLRKILAQEGYIAAKPQTQILKQNADRNDLHQALSPIVKFSKLDFGLIIDKKASIEELKSATKAVEKARKVMDSLLETLEKRLKNL